MSSSRFAISCCCLSLGLACTPEHVGAPVSPARRDAGRADAGAVDAASIDVRGQDTSRTDTPSVDGALPAGWTCTPAFYSDADCDCGCGLLDPTCPDGLASTCQYSWCPNSGTPDPDENWICVSITDAGPSDTSVPDAASPDTWRPDTTPVDTGPPPLQRDEACTGMGVGRCTAGLVCTPSETCQEPCSERHCENNADFCFSSSPGYVCENSVYAHCVDGEGGLKLCRDVNVDFTQSFCSGGGSGYKWYYHSDQSLPVGCWPGWLEFTTVHICISGVIDSQLTSIAHDLDVITTDPSGYTDTSSCNYFSSIELNGLQVIGGDLHVGDVSGHTSRSDIQVRFSSLELPVLEAVYGQMRYTDAPHVTHINMPELAYVGGFFVLDNLPVMETVYLPGLEVIEGGLRIHDLPALTALRLDNLRRIDGYVSIWNLPCVDAATVDAIAALATGPVSLNNVGTGVGCP